MKNAITVLALLFCGPVLAQTPLLCGNDIPSLMESLTPEGLHADRQNATDGVRTGEQKIAVTLVHFPDRPVPCSLADIKAKVEQVDLLYREITDGQVWFSVDYFETTGDVTPTECNPNDASILGRAAAGEGYQRYVHYAYLPCPWAGVSSVGYDWNGDTDSWVIACAHADVLGHELGHAFGMNHASSMTLSTGEKNEYGETQDIMGISGYPLRQINAPHRWHMGWMDTGNAFEVTESGRYVFEAINDPSATGTQLLLISRPSSDGTPDYYYYHISHRAPIGFDGDPSGTIYAYWDSVTIHRFPRNNDRSRTYRLSWDQWPYVTKVGDTFDDNAGIRITVVSIVDHVVTVDIEIDQVEPPPPPPPTAAPSSVGKLSANFEVLFTWVPPTTREDGALLPQIEIKSYRIVCDRDGLLSLDRTVPNDPAVGTNSHLEVGAFETPGTYVCIAYTIDTGDRVSNASEPVTKVMEEPPPPAQCSDGLDNDGDGFIDYPSDPGCSSPDDNDEYNEPPEPQDTESPTAPSTLAWKAAKGWRFVDLSWSASTDNVGVAGYNVYADGSLVSVVSSLSVRLDMMMGATYWVTAFDEAGNESGPSPSVTAVRGKGGKGKN